MSYNSRQKRISRKYGGGYSSKRSNVLPKLLLGSIACWFLYYSDFTSLFVGDKSPTLSPIAMAESSSATTPLPVIDLQTPPVVPLEQALPVVTLNFEAGAKPVVDALGVLDSVSGGRFAAQTSEGDIVYFTPDPDLQKQAESILKKYQVPWGAIVAVDPSSGKILALASHSVAEPGSEPVALRSSFPAASLFKIVTAAAALERTNIRPNDQVAYRGGTYTLNLQNYLPDAKRDSLHMSLRSAISRSCNPVFGRIGLQSLSPADLLNYAESFGFNAPLASNFTLPESRFVLPENDFQQARTAAGFGPVTLSPLHAALLAAAIANDGIMMKPRYIDEVRGLDGSIVYRSKSEALKRVVLSSTAKELMEMLRGTVTEGTAKKAFGRAPSLTSIPIAAKTGTLNGNDPKGLYQWLIAAAPAAHPEIAIAALVINPGNARINGAGIGKEFLEHYFAHSSAKTS